MSIYFLFNVYLIIKKGGNMSFGRLMKEYRNKRGLSQEDLAAQLNKSRIMIYNYERDRNEVPDLVKIK